MPEEETFEEKVIRLLEQILKQLNEIETKIPSQPAPSDYGDPI